MGATWTGSEPNVTNRLYAVIMLFFGVTCLSGGYWLGLLQQNRIRQQNSELPSTYMYKLTEAAEDMYKIARRVQSNASRFNDTQKIGITSKLQEIFNCSRNENGSTERFNVTDLLRNCVNNDALKLLRTVYNVTEILDWQRKRNRSL